MTNEEYLRKASIEKLVEILTGGPDLCICWEEGIKCVYPDKCPQCAREWLKKEHKEEAQDGKG